MRPLELLIAGLIFIAMTVRFLPLPGKKNGFPFLPLLACLIIPLHLLLEGYRWQMIPLFVFALGFMILGLARNYNLPGKDYVIKNKISRLAFRVLIILVYIASVIFPALLPLVDLPQPAGPYAVGTVSLRMTDFGREEIFTEDSLDTRSLLVKAWYPAEVADGKTRSSYWDREGRTGEAYSISAGMGRFWYTHLSLVKTNSYEKVPVLSAKSPFPVLFYSPSFYGMNTENTMLLEELASQGYVVFSITHTYESIVSVFPDGEVIPGNLDHISKLYDSNTDREDRLYEEYRHTGDTGRKTELIKQILVVDELFNQLVKIRMEDAVFVLDEMETLNNQEGIFQARLDLDRVGILGWSFGGAAVLETCMADSRFKAGINIDGWPYGTLFNSAANLSQPMMQIRSEPDDETGAEQEDIISELIFEKSERSAYQLRISGASHMNFWDFPLFFRIYKSLGYWGAIDPLRLLEIESKYITAFFDKYLSGKSVDLPEGGSDLFPELSIRVK